MSAILIFFYTVFLSQIFLLSYYYPKKFSNRVKYILANYPPSEYPKLYPKPYDYYAEKGGKNTLRAYKNLNLFVVLVGLAGLAAMAQSGYSPNPKGGSEVLVLAYAALQSIPHLLAEFAAAKYFKRMKKENIITTRQAVLSPRHLVDFISPVYVVMAFLLYVLWVISYLYNRGFSAPWTVEVYISLVVVTAVNFFIAANIFKFLNGARSDPHQAYKDQLVQIKAITRIGVFVSIIMSLFLMLTDAMDQYSWEIFDPVATSFYVQLIMVFGLGMRFREAKIEDIDFDVYKESALG